VLSDRAIRKKASRRDGLPEGHQSLLHARERRRPHGRGNGRLSAGIGEIIGGSQSEERLEVLDRNMAERGIDKEHYAWYRDLRRYGTAPHAGCGLGFERTLAYVSVRDAIPFPRTPGHAQY
jgi:hypothetical protein